MQKSAAKGQHLSEQLIQLLSILADAMGYILLGRTVLVVCRHQAIDMCHNAACNIFIELLLVVEVKLWAAASKVQVAGRNASSACISRKHI